MRIFKMFLAVLAAILGFYVMNQTKTLDSLGTLVSVFGKHEDSAAIIDTISTGIKAMGFTMLGGGVLMSISSIKPKKELDIASFVVFLVATLVGLFTFYPYKGMLDMAGEDTVARVLLIAAMATGLCLVLAASNIYDFLKLKKAEEEERLRQFQKKAEEERKASGSKSNWGDDIE